MKANTGIANIDTEGSWVNIEAATVHQLWESEHPSIRQVGLLKDASGEVIKFVSWEKSGLPLMAEGIEYDLKNLVVGRYGEYFSVSMNRTTEITRVPVAPQAPPATPTV